MRSKLECTSTQLRPNWRLLKYCGIIRLLLQKRFRERRIILCWYAYVVLVMLNLEIVNVAIANLQLILDNHKIHLLQFNVYTLPPFAYLFPYLLRLCKTYRHFAALMSVEMGLFLGLIQLIMFITCHTSSCGENDYLSGHNHSIMLLLLPCLPYSVHVSELMKYFLVL